jgi:Domain of unknown function (DUF4203)
MLPAALQLPAAVVLVVSGLLACFAGYRLFRIVLAIYGFILGAAIASSVMGPGEGTAMIVGAVVGGLAGALLLNLAYFVGVALIGAAAGALLLHGLWARFGTGDPHVGLVVVCAVLGAVIATNLQRWVIILATASGGAWTLIVGASALMGDRAAKVAAATKDVWVFYPMNLEPGRRWLLGVWLLVAIAGVVVQTKGKGKGKGKVPVARVKKRRD